MGAGVLAEFLDGETPEVESRGEEQPEVAPGDFDKLRRVEAVHAGVLLAPEGGNGGRADLGMAIHRHGEMDSKKRIPEVGNGIDVGPESRAGFRSCRGRGPEGEDPVVLGESEIECDAVGVESRAVDDIARVHQSGGGVDRISDASKVAAPARTRTPSRRASSRIAAMTAEGSAVAVSGDQRARPHVFTRGSMRRASPRKPAAGGRRCACPGGAIHPAAGGLLRNARPPVCRTGSAPVRAT